MSEPGAFSERDPAGAGEPTLPRRRSRFVLNVAEAVSGPCRMPSEAAIVVAVSGGADSLALLASLASLATRPDRRYRLCVAHVNHHLRPEADEEAKLVARIARRLRLDHVQGDLDLDPGAPNLPARARRQRYAFLGETARQFRADAIATGHHATDQLETVLMALLRGAGVDGLTGMPWRSRVCDVEVIRPLLRLTHEDCVNLLKEVGWPWCEDPSNRREDSPRARLRRDVLPVLRELAPDIESRVQRSCDQMADVLDLIDRGVQDLFGPDPGREHDRDRFRETPAIILGAGLRREAQQLGAPLDKMTSPVVRPVVDAIRDCERHPRCYDWPGGVVVRVTARTVRLEPASRPLTGKGDDTDD